MSTRIPMIAALCLALGVLTFPGCGNDGDGDGGGNNNGFAGCGDGRVSGSEACDDGNLLDGDACLATCQLNVCGDGFTNPAAEACDILPLPSTSCQSEGFSGGTIACTEDCTLDTSGCTGQGGPVRTPTPIATPTFDPNAPTPTATDGGSEPTATPTPGGGGGGSCTAGESVVVTLTIDVAYGAARLDLQYPADQMNVPGSGTAPSVVERVEFAASGGLTTVNDDDNTATLTASLVGFAEQPAGTFATVTFDCVSGVVDPAAFTCSVVSASTPGGVAIPDAGCTVAVP
jgi:cysteine-rich repeat protein